MAMLHDGFKASSAAHARHASTIMKKGGPEAAF
jgi:hypothetical protein